MTTKELVVFPARVKYQTTRDGLASSCFRVASDQCDADVLWWDGDIKDRDFSVLGPVQRINKIPGMDYICFKSSTIHAFNQMRRLFPRLYGFFPASFLLPHQLRDLQTAHRSLLCRLKGPVTWIVKPRNGCCGSGIRLMQHIYELSEKREPSVVQRYVEPYLLDGYKFDFRLYILISTLAPYTVYIYNEGLARFCTEKYSPPSPVNLADRFVHLTNTSINKENKDGLGNFTRLFSEVLDEIISKDPKNGPRLWKKICNVSMLSCLAIWSSIVGSLLNFNSERRVFIRKPDDKGDQVLDTFSRYFHIIGIDIMLSKNLQPVVLELNDKPSMAVSYDIEYELKKNMVKEALDHISLDGSPKDDADKPGNWTKIFPVDPNDKLASSVSQVILKSANVFRTYAANRERPHYEERLKTQRK